MKAKLLIASIILLICFGTGFERARAAGVFFDPPFDYSLPLGLPDPVLVKITVIDHLLPPDPFCDGCGGDNGYQFEFFDKNNNFLDGTFFLAGYQQFGGVVFLDAPEFQSQYFVINNLGRLQVRESGGYGGFLGFANTEFTIDFAGQAPLPATLPLFLTGLGALGLMGWRRKRSLSAIA